MSWAVGDERRWQYAGRYHIGYGVPAYCDKPACGATIDRGLGYACGDGVVGDVDNCGLFFCSEHLFYVPTVDGEIVSSARATELQERGLEIRMVAVCQRCADGETSYDPTPEHPEWLTHVINDESWRKWRDENPTVVRQWESVLGSTSPQ